VRSTLLLLCSLLSACVVQEPNHGPRVGITLFGSIPWTEDDAEQIMLGATVWEPMGFIYYFDPEGDRSTGICPFDWYRLVEPDCKISVGVTKKYGLAEQYGVAAWADRAEDIIEIDARYYGDYLRHLSAHEFGHILLNTSWHLPAGVHGIMGQGNGLIYPTKADESLACAATGICVDL
jgi:hypothetical protein